MATKKKSTTAPTALTTLRDVQPNIASIEYKDAAELQAAYDAADQDVKQTAEASLDKQVDVIAALAKMRSILSQRGSERVRQQAGLKTWTQYFGWFQQTYKFQMSLRNVINKIAVLGGKKLCPSCGKANGHTPSCRKYKAPAPQLSPNECRLIGVLNAANDLLKAVEQGGNIQAAAKEYKNCAPTQQRLEEWIERQVLPYKPEPGDVIAVNGQEFVLLEVCGVSEEDSAHVLTIALEPVRRANATPATQPAVAGQRKPPSSEGIIEAQSQKAMYKTAGV
jgi:hypothetical protein